MPPRLLKTDAAAISEAAQHLLSGGLVIFPTETVYGIGANAFSEEALKKIFIAKGRPQDNPLIVHVADRLQLEGVVTSISSLAERLMAAFWPGPLTLLLPKKQNVPDVVTAGSTLVGVRCPAHPVAQALLQAAGVPIAAPSANISGRPSATSAQVAHDDFIQQEQIVILDGGETSQGVESTVLDLSGPVPVILRPGGVTQEALEAVLGGAVRIAGQDDKNLAHSPGTRYAHYQPNARVILVSTDELHSAVFANHLLTLNQRGIHTAVWYTLSEPVEGLGSVVYKTEPATLEQVARELFMRLRQSDQDGVKHLFIETVPVIGIGRAIMNRLERAAGHT